MCNIYEWLVLKSNIGGPCILHYVLWICSYPAIWCLSSIVHTYYSIIYCLRWRVPSCCLLTTSWNWRVGDPWDKCLREVSMYKVLYMMPRCSKISLKSAICDKGFCSGQPRSVKRTIKIVCYVLHYFYFIFGVL